MDQASICNMALSHVGVSTEIQNMLTERSKEAQACRRFWDPSIDDLLRAFPWPFATRIVDLTLVEEDPNDEWEYSYRWPEECLTAHRILSGSRNDSRAGRIPYRIIGDSTGRLILTDMDDAQLEYTARVSTVDQFAPDFIEALALLLAGRLGPRFGPDATTLANRALSLFQGAMARATANASNEEQRDLPPDSEFISVR